MSPNRAHLVAGLLLATAAPASFAADIRPGMWELVVESRFAASPDLASEPVTMTQCLTEDDAQDPSRILGGMANPGAADCTYTEKTFNGNVFRFKMQCAGMFGIEAKGEISYSATSMDGSIVTIADMAGQTTELRSRVRARRAGGC